MKNELTARERNEAIQRRAYELWDLAGRPEGREHSHWLQAEREFEDRAGARGGTLGGSSDRERGTGATTEITNRPLD